MTERPSQIRMEMKDVIGGHPGAQARALPAAETVPTPSFCYSIGSSTEVIWSIPKMWLYFKGYEVRRSACAMRVVVKELAVSARLVVEAFSTVM